MQQHRDVQSLLRELAEHLVALLLVGCVDVEILRLAGPPAPPPFLDVAADLGSLLVSALPGAVDADDVVPRLRERPRRSFTEPAGRPENQRPFGRLYLRVCVVWHGDIIAHR